MNGFILIAGIFATLTCVGHFTVGRKEYLIPMLKADFDPVPKKVMQCVFRYVSAFLVTSTLLLLAVGFGVPFKSGFKLPVDFVAINYAAFSVTQLVIAFKSGLPQPAKKMFQWIFFTLIAVFAWIGIVVG